jgi:hypothetical protein
MDWWKYSITLVLLSACQTQSSNPISPPGPIPHLESDAHITFFLQGKPIVISDSTGGEAMASSMYARNDTANSTFFASGRTGGGPTIIFNILLPLKTGTVQLNGRNNATIYLDSGAYYSEQWATDSIHTGLLTIDSNESVNNIDNSYGFISADGIFSGTFHFAALDTINGTTIRIDSGVITNMWYYNGN